MDNDEVDVFETGTESEEDEEDKDDNTKLLKDFERIAVEGKVLSLLLKVPGA